MARNKSKLNHPATWVHAAIHAALLGIALGWQAGIVLGAVHVLIDTRLPMNWWRKTFRQTEEGPYAIMTAVWADQVLHLVAIGAWVYIVA
jgi:ABC-type Mn2+/Zn2+ transport system permease subunit